MLGTNARPAGTRQSEQMCQTVPAQTAAWPNDIVVGGINVRGAGDADLEDGSTSLRWVSDRSVIGPPLPSALRRHLLRPR